MKLFNTFFLLMTSFLSSNLIEEPKANTLEWHSIHELENLPQLDDKLIIVKLHATWCSPCKMLGKTFEDEAVQNSVAENFNVVEFDVETKESISFKGKDYHFKEKGKVKYNELALEMLDNRLSYPAVLVLDNELNKVKLLSGYKDAENLLAELSTL